MTEPVDPFVQEAQAAAEVAPPAATRQRKPRAAASQEAVKEAAYWDEKVWVQFHESEDMPPLGVPVQVNGVAYFIKPGIPVKVPRKVLHAVDNAVQSKPILQDGKVRGYRSVSRFPYAKLSQGEIDAVAQQ